MDQRAFSADGFLIRQEYCSTWPYGHMSSDINGCGWIAAYNLLHALGREISCDEVNVQLGAILPGGGFLGTPFHTLRTYLHRQGLLLRYSRGKRATAQAMQRSTGGIVRYLEGKEPHYVAFWRADEQHLRFFNVLPELSDYQSRAEDFLNERLRLPIVRALTTEESPPETMIPKYR